MTAPLTKTTLKSSLTSTEQNLFWFFKYCGDFQLPKKSFRDLAILTQNQSSHIEIAKLNVLRIIMHKCKRCISVMLVLFARALFHQVMQCTTKKLLNCWWFSSVHWPLLVAINYCSPFSSRFPFLYLNPSLHVGHKNNGFLMVCVEWNIYVTPYWYNELLMKRSV